MDIILAPLLYVMLTVISLYQWGLVIYIILGWLDAFQVINRYNRFVSSVSGFLFRIIEPALEKIRVFVPFLGTIDLSPFVLYIILFFIEGVLHRVLLRFPA